MRSMLHRAGVIAAFSLAASSFGQEWPCVEGWSGPSLPGVAGQLNTYSVSDLKWWDPDGPGPRPPIVLVAGSFFAAGDVFGSSLLGYEPETRRWRHVVSPISGSVEALYPLDDGRLVAVGWFSGANLPSGARFAIWNGASWEDDSQGIDGLAYSVERLPSGEFVIGTTTQILRRTPAGWLPMHGDEIYGTAKILKVAPDGRLFAGGSLRLNQTQHGVMMWDGVSWTNVYESGGDFIYPGGIGFIEVLPDGCLLFSRVVSDGARTPAGIVRWCDGQVADLTRIPYEYGTIGGYGRGALVQPNGSVLVEAEYELSPRVLFSTMLELGLDLRWRVVSNFGFGARKMLGLGEQRYLHNNASPGGIMERFQHQPRRLGDGLDASVLSLLEMTDGRLIVSGDFATGGNTPLSRIAVYDGNVWVPLGGGLDTACRCAVRLPDGSTAVGGNFFGFYGNGLVPSPRVARWNGTVWEPMGIPNVGRVRLLFLDATQQLFAFADSANTGVSPLQRRVGQAWVQVPIPSGLTDVRAMVEEPDGSRIFGSFEGSGLYRWDGVTWTLLGRPAFRYGLNAMARLPDGDIVVGATYLNNPATALCRLDRQTGTWTNYGSALNGSVISLETLPRQDGGVDLLVAGEFTTAASTGSRYIARWVPETNQWFPVGIGANAPVRAVRRLSNGEIVVAGDFTRFDGKAAAFISRYRVPCPADFTCDSLVDGDDVIAFFGAWDTADLRADFDGDGAATTTDVLAFMEAWDSGC